jgi:hypothetical protein
MIGIRQESNAQVIFLRSVDIAAQNENRASQNFVMRNSAMSRS